MNAPPMSKPDADATSPRRALLVALVAAAAAAAYTAAADMPSFVGDDGGITLRYAERLASGRGFSYNDGEHINGSSNPLFTAIVAALLWAGASPAIAVLSCGYAGIAVGAGALVYAFARTTSVASAVVAGLALVVNPLLHTLLFNGLESPLTLLLAMVCVVAVACGGEIACGLAVGALVANKLDGAAAALALVAASAIADRRLPVRAAVVALAVYAPVVVAQLVAFGSPIPNSAATKLTRHFDRAFDSWWVLDGMRSFGHWSFPAGVGGALSLFAPSARSRVGVFTLTWLAGHAAAFSLVDLGDSYPWYLLVPVILLAPLAALFHFHATSLLSTLAHLSARARESLRWGAAIAIFALGVWPIVRYHLVPEHGAHDLAVYAESDLARQAAGAWLRKHTSATELLASPWGLPAYEYGGPVYDPTQLNSTKSPERFVSARYYVGEFAIGMPSEQAYGSTLVAFFRCGRRAVGYAVYAREESEIIATGVTHLGAPGELDAGSRLESGDLKVSSRRMRERIDGIGDAPDAFAGCVDPDVATQRAASARGTAHESELRAVVYRTR